MRLPRRGFVKTGVLSAISAGIVASNPGLLFSQKGQGTQSDGLRSIPLSARRNPVYAFTQATFAGFVGDIFTTPNARGRKLELELVKVSGYEPNPKARMMLRKGIQPATFSLTFLSADELPPFTSIHKLNHAKFGEFPLFMTRSRREDGLYSYEAVISHL
ncbi:MAG TPA: hypothetical protein VJU84_19425 [Pyrinomonadaceae bacterium]|nr:hypothetical protein [Pyrinomonadaceae bacterium]